MVIGGQDDNITERRLFQSRIFLAVLPACRSMAGCTGRGFGMRSSGWMARTGSVSTGEPSRVVPNLGGGIWLLARYE